MATLKSILGLAAIGLLGLGLAPLAAQTAKVGTFHEPSLVVAYYRSPQWAEISQAKISEMENAKKANDTKKVAEMRSWGQNHQELAHRQLAGEAPLTNILEAMAPAFEEIARKAGVARIVGSQQSQAQGVETVDVTDPLLDWLKADERTRKICAELRSRKGPMPHLH